MTYTPPCFPFIRQNNTIVDTVLSAPRSSYRDIVNLTDKQVQAGNFSDMKVVPGYYTVATDRGERLKRGQFANVWNKKFWLKIWICSTFMSQRRRGRWSCRRAWSLWMFGFRSSSKMRMMIRNSCWWRPSTFRWESQASENATSTSQWLKNTVRLPLPRPLPLEHASGFFQICSILQEIIQHLYRLHDLSSF